MAISTIDTPTMQLAQLATRLFGEEWAGALSRFTGIGLRNCQRAKAAAEAGEEERRAGAILGALVAALEAVAPQVNAAAEEVRDGTGNPFGFALLPDHAGLDLTMDEQARRGLRELVRRATSFRDESSNERLLLALAYDLRKAREAQLSHSDETEAVTVRALWPLLLFQLKMLRATCAYIATTPSEVLLLDNLESTVFAAIYTAYHNDNAEDLIESWHELGADPCNDTFDDDALSRSAWFIEAEASRRRETLVHLLESMSALYVYAEDQEGRPRLEEFEPWRNGRWPHTAW